jgi:amino acid adenylation domain-containing protein
MTHDNAKSNLEICNTQPIARELVPHIPSDRPRGDKVPQLRASLDFVLPKLLTEKTVSFVEGEGAVLANTLLSVLQILLYCYTDCLDILVETKLIGYCSDRFYSDSSKVPVCQQLFCVQLSDSFSFRECLYLVNTEIQGAKVQFVNSKELRNSKWHLPSNRDPQSSSPFAFIYLEEHESIQSSSFSDIEITDNFDKKLIPELIFSIVNRGSKFVVTLNYNSYLFEYSRMLRLLAHYEALLSSAIENPEAPISNLNILKPVELRQLLVDWNGNKVSYAQKCYAHQLFSAQVAQTPDAIAAICEASHLTYLELERRSNQLARYLKQLNVGPEVSVGLFLPPCLEVVVGLLGIFKAGGVYVPLDPTYPQTRLNFLLEDSQISVVLSLKSLLPLLPQYTGTVICFDSDWEAINSQKETQLENLSNPHDAAYIVYTSGTTGKPKGVVAEHRNLTNYLLATCDRFKFDCQDMMPCIARYSFSISLFELLTPLISGGIALILPRERVLDINRFIQDLEGVTNFHAVPGLMWQIVDAISIQSAESKRYNNIKRIFVGGDRVPSNLLEQMREIFPSACIFVLYGCSEATTLLLNYSVPKESIAIKNIVGKTFNNMSVRLYNRHRNLVPVGLTGEIYVGGMGVTRGYLNRADLTGEKYVTIDEERWYRTGDLGRYDADGNIEFIGRADYQVKIRGVRIELGELEAVLSSHPAVNKSVVIARDDKRYDKQLIAYVVPNRGQKLTSRELYSFLLEKVLTYMMPADFVILDTFPLNQNGKVDRLALPTPQQAKSERSCAFTAPQSELEFQLVDIWEEVLGVFPISVTDDFYELGGNSLSAVRLFVSISKSLHRDLPFTILFQASTIQQLAEILSQEKITDSHSSIVTIQKGGSQPPLFCIHGAGGGVFYYRNLAQCLETNQPVYGLQARGMNGEKPLTLVAEMAELYVNEIRQVQPLGPYFITGYSFGAVLAFEMARKLSDNGQQVAFLGLIEYQAPGYRKPLPFGRKMLGHLSNLLSTGPTYIQQKLAEKSQCKYTRRQQSQNQLTLQAYQDGRKPLPYEFRHISVREACRDALRTHKWCSYTGNIHLFVASDERKSPRWDFDPYLGWGNYALGGIEAIEVPGNHNSVIQEPNIKVLAEKMGACLKHIQARNFVN